MIGLSLFDFKQLLLHNGDIVQWRQHLVARQKKKICCLLTRAGDAKKEKKGKEKMVELKQ